MTRQASRLVWMLLLAGCTEVILGGRPGSKDDTDVVPPDDTTPPIAVCAANPDRPKPLESVDFLGELSYDPDEIPLIDHRWDLLDAPDGSSAELPRGDENREGFLPDMIGDYTASLVVVNDRGNSSEVCTTTFRAETEHALWIELTWEYPDENLDLHLVRDRGPLTNRGDDCWAGGCDLSWGTSNADDDPELPRDDVTGTGPELAGILAPAAGTYKILVIDDDSLRRAADNTATVTIYIDGIAAWRASKVFVEEGRTLEFATIEWPSQRIEEL